MPLFVHIADERDAASIRRAGHKGHRTSVGVYFRLHDSEPVWIGHYNEPKRTVTAAEEDALLEKNETLGFETTIPRSILPREIHAIRPLPQVLGWRYSPDSHQRGISCCCKFCQKSNIKGRRLWERHERESGTNWDLRTIRVADAE